MNMTRRAFILNTGFVAAAPALASMLTTPSNAGSSALPNAGSSQSDLPVAQTAGYDLPFRIAGWESRKEIPLGDAPTALEHAAIQARTDERMWISINQSWRATWR
jgi:hypothetical protein